MTPDPYKALNLPHDASATQIKLAYRRLALQYHPDRLQRNNASELEMRIATTKFSKIASAYALLTDEARKREYDHIYKYGGFDDVVDESEQSGRRRRGAPTTTAAPQHSDSVGMGVGYSCTDHISYLLSQGRETKKTMAGIQIPSRLHLSRPMSSSSNGFRLTFSSGQLKTSATGTKEYTSKTTQFFSGRKVTRMETTKVHPDGRKEILIEGDNYTEHRFEPPKRKLGQRTNDEKVSTQDDSDAPWYMSAWHEIRDKLSACHNVEVH